MNFCLLLDENVPYPAADGLRQLLPGVPIWHVYDLGFASRDDADLLAWASQKSAITITFDEDLADLRRFPLGSHAGVIRLRVDPCTTELTIKALTRLFGSFSFEELAANLTIVDEQRIRVVTAKKEP